MRRDLDHRRLDSFRVALQLVDTRLYDQVLMMSSERRIPAVSVGTAGPSVHESQDIEQGFELAEMSRQREASSSGPATTGAATETSSAGRLGTPETGSKSRFALPIR